MKILLNFLKLWDCTEKCRFDLSLARGLDYYTGPIFEVIFSKGLEFINKNQAIIVTDEKRSEAGTTVGVGSVAGGGRYDNLVGSFAGGKGQWIYWNSLLKVNISSLIEHKRHVLR